MTYVNAEHHTLLAVTHMCVHASTPRRRTSPPFGQYSSMDVMPRVARLCLRQLRLAVDLSACVGESRHRSRV